VQQFSTIQVDKLFLKCLKVSLQNKCGDIQDYTM
jgi:hypothetical protein